MISVKEKSRIGTRLGYLSVGVNLLLFAVKLVLGILSNSVSILSDAFHTLSDILTSALVIVSFKISSKPSDLEHPFGHGRAEQIAAIVMATLLGVTAFELAKTSLGRLFDPAPIQASWWVAAVMLVTVFIKEWLARFTSRYSIRFGSDTLAGDAWHHRTDAISTLLVVAAIVLARYGITFMDGIVGILIGFYILYVAYGIVKRPVDLIMGQRTPPEVIFQIKKIGDEIPQIREVHDIIYHNYGNHQLVSLHIEVDEDMTLSEAHRVSEEMTTRIRDELGLHPTVHVDPMAKKTELHTLVERAIAEICKEHHLCESFHELRVSDSEAEIIILFDLQVNKEMSGKAQRELKRHITTLLKEQFPQIKHIRIEIDPLFVLE